VRFGRGRGGCYLVVLTRVYVPARALRMSCSEERFWVFEMLFGRAVASDAQAMSDAEMELSNMLCFTILNSSLITSSRKSYRKPRKTPGAPSTFINFPLGCFTGSSLYPIIHICLGNAVHFRPCPEYQTWLFAGSKAWDLGRTPCF
jgi:hypothetical protein